MSTSASAGEYTASGAGIAPYGPAATPAYALSSVTGTSCCVAS
ncbi:MAG TPA: hypothetical protein VGJ13_03640 [Pseudonocardiaceae bacterium]